MPDVLPADPVKDSWRQMAANDTTIPEGPKAIDPNAQLKLAARDKAADPFSGLQEVKPNDPFAGLQEVKPNDPFSGLKQADALDVKDVPSLVADDSFRPADYFASNPDLRKDEAKSQKLLDVYRARRIRGPEMGKVLNTARKEALPIVGKTLLGARDLASRFVETAIQPTATSILSALTGATPEEKAAIMAEQGKEQLKAAGEVTAGTESAITGLTQLGYQGYRKLFGKSPEKLSDRELFDQLVLDSEFSKATKEVAEGRGDVVKAAGLDADTLARIGVTLDKEAIEHLSLVDPLTLVATAGAFKVVGLGGRVIATAATKVGAQTVIDGLAKVAQNAVAKGVEATGKAASVVGKTSSSLVERLPAKSIGFILGATKGGSLQAGAIGAAAGEAAKRITVESGEALARRGERLAEFGAQLKPGFIGPRSAGLTRLAELPATAPGRIAKSVAGGAVQGAVTAIPLAAAADESETAGALLAGGVGLGATHGLIHGTGTAVAETVAKNYLDPHNIPFEKTNSPGYGVDKSLDASHDAAITKLPENEQNAVNTFREAVRAGGGEIYVQDAGSYLNRIRENLTQENGGKPLTPEQEAQAKLYADTHAFFDGQIPDGKGETRRVVFLNSDSTGLHHDAGHLFQSLLSPENQAALRESALSSYSPEQLQAFKDEYARRIGEPDYFSKLGEEAGNAKAADELIAENFGQLFQNKTFSELSAPQSFLKKLANTAVNAGEALGFDLTAGRKTADLRVTPSLRLQDLLRNAAQDVLTRESAPVKEKPLTLRPEDVARREANVPVTKELTPELVKPAEPAPAPEAKPVEPAAISPKEPVLPPGKTAPVSELPASTAKNIRVEKTAQSDFASKRAKETGVAEAQKATESQPEVRKVVDDIAASMEAGNPVLEVEHRGIVSEKGPGNPEGRTSRRGTQEAGYQELERLQVENRAEAPAGIIDLHQKTFVPVRFTTQGGKPTLIAMSLDKVIANVRKVVSDTVANAAEKLLPHPVENGKLTDAGWKQAISDVQAYAENQSNGYRGDGQKLTRPTEDIGVSLPAENPNYTPKPLSEGAMNFANLVQGLAPPETGRVQKGLTPGNVKGQLLAEINKRQPMTPAVIKPENVTKQGFKGFEPRTVKETNPLRNELAARGVKVRELIEVTERLAVQDIASVKPRPDLVFKAPVPDIIRAGYLPKEVEKLLSELPATRVKTRRDLSTPAGQQAARAEAKQSRDYLFSDADKTPGRLGELLTLSPGYFQEKVRSGFNSTSDRIWVLKNGGEGVLKQAAQKLEAHDFLDLARGNVPAEESVMARAILDLWRQEKHPEDYSTSKSELDALIPGETGIRVPAPVSGPFGMFKTSVPPESVPPPPPQSLTGTGFESHKELVSAMLSPEAHFEENPLTRGETSFSAIVQKRPELSVGERGELRGLLKKQESRIRDIAGILDGEVQSHAEYDLPGAGGIAEAGTPPLNRSALQDNSLANYAESLYRDGEFRSRELAYDYVRDTAQSIIAAKNTVRWATGFFRDPTLSDSIKTHLKNFAERVQNSTESVWQKAKESFSPPEVPEPFLTQKSLESVNWGLVEDTIRSLSPEDYKQDFGNLPEHRISDVTESLTLHPEKSPNSYSPGDRKLLQKIYRYGREQLQDRGESTAKFLPSDKPVSELGPDIAKMSPDEWRKFTESNGGHLTPEAYKLGLGLKDKADLELLRKFQAEHDTKGSEALKSGDFDTAMTEATKSQFFREAAEAATDTGSAANPRVGWRRVLPGAKPPFAGGETKFLPRTEAGKKAAEKGFDITVEGNLGIREAVIRKGDKVVGKIVSSSPENISEASINFADVNPKLRGQGLGEAAYRELLTQLKEDGVKDVTGITVAGQPLAIREKIFGKGSTEITDPENLGDRGNIPVDQAIAELNDGGLGFNARNKITPESKFLPKTDAGKELAKKGFDLQLDENSDKTQFVIRAVDKTGEDVGRLEFKIDDFGNSELSNVFVNPGSRKQGIGSTLYKEMGGYLQREEVSRNTGEIISPAAVQRRKSVFPTTTFRNSDGERLTVSEAIRDADEGLSVYAESYVPKTTKFLPKGNKPIRDLASEYAKKVKLPYTPHETYAPLNPKLGEKLADFYDSAKSDPSNPEVQKSYQALADETLAQYKAMTDAGYKIEPFTGKGEPYPDSAAAIADIRDNKHLYFLKTEGNFSGERSNPMLADSGIKIDGEPLLVNDVFRAVHDFFGHGKEGYQFGPRGEFNAWRAHSEMYSPEAQGALAAETLAQNSWVNFGKHLRGKEVALKDRPFAEQKAVIVPDELIQEAKGGAQFLPKKRGVTEADVQKRDSENRPLTKEGLVDYEKLYAEKTKRDKEQESADLKSIEGKYTMPENAPKAGPATGWILPDGKFVPLDANYHEQFLANNSAELNKKFGTKFGETADVMERQDALNKGFVRVRYTPNNGGLRVEVGAAHWTPKTKKAILQQAENQLDTIDHLSVSLLDERGATVDSVNGSVASLEGPEKFSAISDSIGGLRGTGPKFLPSNEQNLPGMNLPSEEKIQQNRVKSRITKAKDKFPEALPPEYAKDDAGNFITDFNGKPKPVLSEYRFADTPVAREAAKGIRGPEAREEAASTAIAEKLVTAAKAAQKNPDIAAGVTWYSTARTRLKKLLGDDTKLFSELLGATSARTPVETNFRFSLDAYNQFKRGAYDDILKKYREGKDRWVSGEIGDYVKATKDKEPTRAAFMDWWIQKHDLTPTQSNGKKFAMNSQAVLKVLDGSWATEVQGPKTPNFAGNLSGQTFEATIDVWASRLIHHLANEGSEKPWRILPENETGLSDSDFYLGQAIFRKAAEKLKMKPDALQAILWFAEKDHWEKNGWTRGAGAEKSDFNSLLKETERTPEGTLKQKTPQLDLGISESDIQPKAKFLPMKKPDYKKAVAKAGFELYDWLTTLPQGHVLSNPVPLVVVPVGEKPPPGFSFQWSTFFHVEGYHHPKGTKIVAMVATKPK